MTDANATPEPPPPASDTPTAAAATVPDQPPAIPETAAEPDAGRPGANGSRPAGDARSGRRPPDIPFAAVLELAEACGVQPERAAAGPGFIRRGYCPFHPGRAANRHDRTLTLNLRTESFNCQNCGVRGGGPAFVARIWQTTIQDAVRLYKINDRALTPQRPAYPESDGPNNMAVLNMAYRHYNEELCLNDASIGFLNALGISPRKAQRCGIGYAPGDTLYDYLRDQGVSEDDLLHNSLFDNDGSERMAGRITISDLDAADAALQMASFYPQYQDGPGSWSRRKPALHHAYVPHRPYLLGELSAPRDAAVLAVTDDPRFYIVARAEAVPCILLSTQKDQGQIARHIAARRPRRVVMATHNGPLSRNVLDCLAANEPPVPVELYDHAWTVRNLNYRERDLTALRDGMPPTPTADAPSAALAADAAPIPATSP